MLEYLIRPTEDEFINLQQKDWSKTLRPTSFQSTVIEGWGDLRLEIQNGEVSFSDEQVGIHIVFESDDIAENIADQIVQEICNNLISFTNQQAVVVPI